MDKKGPYTIKELRSLEPGTQIWGKFLVIDKISRKTRDGRELISLRLGDASGEIDAVVWDTCTVQGAMESGEIVGLQGDLGTYNQRLQIKAKRIKMIDEDIALYQRGPATGIDNLSTQFDQLCTSITDPCLSELISRIFNEQMREQFLMAPAAKKIHHYYRGGLLEHTINVARLCEEAVGIYPQLNRDLLLTGAILHDIGKVLEYEARAAVDYSAAGRMMGHIILGSDILSNVLEAIKAEKGAFPEELELMLRHMILSHHGMLEFGSPVKPLFPEALLLHMMDNLDAKMFVFCDRIEEDEERDDVFTPYDTLFGQQFYKFRYFHAKEETSQHDLPGDVPEITV